MIRLLFFSVTILFIGCSSPKTFQEVDIDDAPDWFFETPSAENVLFAARTGVSRDMQFALDKATADARAEIARQVETKVQEIQKRFVDETSSGEDIAFVEQMTRASKSVVNVSLSGAKIVEKVVEEDGDFWRAYVLIEYPLGEARRNFLESLKSNTELFSKVESTQAFKELEAEVIN